MGLNRYRMTGVWWFLTLVLSSSGQSVKGASGVTNPLHLSANHTTASVANLEMEASWYERVLGFKRSALLGGRKDFGLYKMTMPGNRIDLVWQKGSARHALATGRLEQGWLHVVFNTPDLDSAYKHLVAQGTDVQIEKDEQGRVVHLTLHDPEGNEIGLVNE